MPHSARDGDSRIRADEIQRKTEGPERRLGSVFWLEFFLFCERNCSVEHQTGGIIK